MCIVYSMPFTLLPFVLISLKNLPCPSCRELFSPFLLFASKEENNLCKMFCFACFFLCASWQCHFTEKKAPFILCFFFKRLRYREIVSAFSKAGQKRRNMISSAPTMLRFVPARPRSTWRALFIDLINLFNRCGINAVGVADLF